MPTFVAFLNVLTFKIMKSESSFREVVAPLCLACDHLGYVYEIVYNSHSKDYQMKIFGKAILPRCLFKAIPENLDYLVSSVGSSFYILIW